MLTLFNQTLSPSLNLYAQTLVESTFAQISTAAKETFFSRPSTYSDPHPVDLLEKCLGEHSEQLYQIYQGRTLSDYHFTQSLKHNHKWQLLGEGSTKRVVFHQDYPEFVFKMLRRDEEDAVGILQESIDNFEAIRKICTEKKLDKIRIPNSQLLTELNGYDVAMLVEERLPISYEGSVRKIIKMNQSPERQKHLNELIKQKTILVYHALLTDVKENNIGILDHEDRLGIVDVDSKSTSFKENTYQTLIQHLNPANIEFVQQTLIGENPEIFQKLKVSKINQDRLIEAKREEAYEKFKEKYQEISQPIECPSQALEPLSKIQRMLAQHLLTVFNNKIKQLDFMDLEREIMYDHDLRLSNEFQLQFQKEWETLPADEKSLYWQSDLIKQEKIVLNFFVQEGIIFGYSDRFGRHGRIVYG